MEVSGEISAAESRRACAPLQRHLLGWRRFAVWYVAVVVIALNFVAGPMIELLFPVWGSVLLAIVSVGAFFWMIFASQKLLPAAWARRGVSPNPFASYSIEDDALVISSPHSQTRLNWTGISEIIPGNAAWLFIGQGTAYFLPCRFFSEAANEAAFLSACLNRMTAEARALSVEASQTAEAA